MLSTFNIKNACCLITAHLLPCSRPTRVDYRLVNFCEPVDKFAIDGDALELSADYR